MGLGSSVLIIVVSVLVIAAVVYFLGRKYVKSDPKLNVQIKATNDRITVLEGVVVTQGNMSRAIDARVDTLQASKLPINGRVSGISHTHTPTPTVQQSDHTTALMAATLISDQTYNSPSSSISCGSSSSTSSDSGTSDTSSSCSSGSSDSY